MALTARTRSTIAGYLADFIVTERPGSIDQWVDRDDYEAILPVADRLGTERLKPIYEEFDGRISYDTIRLVVAHRGLRVSAPFEPRSKETYPQLGAQM
jgi:ATP-dependent DNA helicase RecQ